MTKSEVQPTTFLVPGSKNVLARNGHCEETVVKREEESELIITSIVCCVFYVVISVFTVVGVYSGHYTWITDMAKSKKTASEPPVIQLVNLTKQFGRDDTQTVALDGINLTIEKGEFVAIMGPSGCGKTTLLNILGLLDTPSEGEYSLDGKHVAEISHRQRAKIRGTQIGFVFQSFNLLNRMNIIDNVAMPLTYRPGLRHQQLKKASDMLKTLELQEREYYMPHQLSGGQLQRVAIARALVNDPSMILADEPTGNLDSKSSELIMNELREIHERGNTIIMVTHNPDLTVYATRILHMKDGKIATDTKTPKKKRNPRRKRRLDTNRKKTAKSSESHLKKAVALAYDGEEA